MIVEEQATCPNAKLDPDLLVPQARTMPLFNSANAAQNAAKSHESRRRHAVEREALRAGADPRAPGSPQIAPQNPALDTFLLTRLARVRKQLNRLDDMVETETDPQKLDRLASAQSRLADQERVLANRPLPGSRRPPLEKKSSASAFNFPEPTPLPVASDATDEAAPRQEQI